LVEAGGEAVFEVISFIGDNRGQAAAP
jgi:hypothetical protein